VKPISEWTKEDLAKLVAAGEPESTTLEYKASQALHRNCRENISKWVSGMANASGGLIVIGIPEVDHLPGGLDQGVQDTTITHEWVENVLTSTIRPPIPDLKIKAIPLGTGTAFVIQVPQATTLAPHQAFDRKYYRRRNFKCEAMEDAEVRDVMRRSNVAHPVLSFIFSNLESTRFSVAGELRVMGTNLSDEPILYSTCDVLFDREFFEDPDAQSLDYWQRSSAVLTMGEHPVPAFRYRANFMVPNHMPFFRGQSYRLFSQRFVIRQSDRWYPLGYRVACPGFSFEGASVVRYHEGIIEAEPDGDVAIRVFQGLPQLT